MQYWVELDAAMQKAWHFERQFKMVLTKLDLVP